MKHLILLVSIVFFTLKANVMYAQQACDIIYDGIDLSTKLYRTEVGPALLFNHTPPEVKNDLQMANLINTRGQIIRLEDKTSLHLNIQVNSLVARKVYGSIDKGGLLKISLIDGKEIELRCYAGSSGVATKDEKGFIYPVAYELSGRQVKQLSKTEIDKVGLQWTSGYEEYVIYEVDFLMHQLSCLEQAKEKKTN